MRSHKDQLNPYLTFEDADIAPTIDAFNSLSSEVERVNWLTQRGENINQDYFKNTKIGEATVRGYGQSVQVANAAIQATGFKAKAAAVG